MCRSMDRRKARNKQACSKQLVCQEGIGRRAVPGVLLGDEQHSTRRDDMSRACVVVVTASWTDT